MGLEILILEDDGNGGFAEVLSSRATALGGPASLAEIMTKVATTGLLHGGTTMISVPAATGIRTVTVTFDTPAPAAA